MHIGFAKLGCVMRITSDKWGPKGGENCPVSVLKRLLDTGHTVTLLSKIDKPAHAAEFLEKYKGQLHYRPAHPSNYADYEGIDAYIVFGGPHFAMQHKTMAARRYTRPLFELLQTVQRPWLYVLTDHRYYPKWYEDLMPTMILAQRQETDSHVLNGSPIEFDFTYGACDRWQFYLQERPTLQTWRQQRTVKLMMACHEHHEGGCLDKLPLWNRVVDLLDPLDYQVYGDWPSRAGHPSYKGIIARSEVPAVLKTAQYSLLIPIETGYITPRLWECVHAGVVPLLWGKEPTDRYIYDDQCHSGIGLDSVLRVDSLDELRENLSDATYHLADRTDLTWDLLVKHRDMYTGELIDREVTQRLAMLADGWRPDPVTVRGHAPNERVTPRDLCIWQIKHEGRVHDYCCYDMALRWLPQNSASFDLRVNTEMSFFFQDDQEVEYQKQSKETQVVMLDYIKRAALGEIPAEIVYVPVKGTTRV